MMQRHLRRRRRCSSESQRDGEGGVSSEASLVRRPVEINKRLIQGSLIKKVSANNGPGDFIPDMPHRASASVAAIASRIAVAKFDGLRRSSGGAGRNRRRGRGAAIESTRGADGRPATAVQNLQGGEPLNLRH